MNKYFTYNDLIRFIEGRSDGYTSPSTIVTDLHQAKSIPQLICLNNQFYHIILFPAFKTQYISANLIDILGYKPEEMNLRKLYGLIHPEDYPISLLATKKMYEFVIDNYQQLEPFRSVMSMDFRIMHKDGHYIRLYNQNCLLEKNPDDKTFKALALSTDITHLKSNTEMEFSYTNKGDGVSCPFPDKELVDFSSLFTHRERQILALLAIGKSSPEIGKALYISRHTVDTHRRKMLSKSHLGNTIELVAYSIANNLIENK